MTADLATAALVQFVSELGDRSFQVVVLLAVWCPFFGMRAGRCEETLLVTLGAGSALTVRVLLVGALQGVGLGWIRFLLLFFAPLVLWFLVSKAWLDYRSADLVWYANLLGVQDKSTGNPAETAPQYATNVFKLPASSPGFDGDVGRQEAGEASYGSVEKAVESQLRGARADVDLQSTAGRAGPMTTAFFVSMFCTFAVSLSDPLRDVGDIFGHFLSPFASILGALGAVGVAVLLGVLAERSLSDRRFLLCSTAVLGMSALSVTTRVFLLLFRVD